MTRPARWLPGLAAGVLLAGLAAFGTGCRGVSDSPAGEGWNVVFLLADTLRADHLGAYGYHRDTSPILDRLAAEGVLFRNHRSQAPCTFPSTNSLLTSRSPQVFESRPKLGFQIPPDTPALPEILQRNGYATLAVSASPIVRATPTRYNRQAGFDRGFDIFLERCMFRRAACVNNDTWGYLPLLREPFFLYLHFMDPHAPYDPPDWHEMRFSNGYEGGKKWVRAGDPNPIASMVYHGAPDVGLTDADLGHLVGLYDDSIRFLDDQIGLLLDKLEERGVLERTMIVFLADHGESFLENGHVAHCRSLHETETRTPLVIKIPSLTEPVRVERLTANLDVVPTVLDYLGLSEDPATAGFEGVTLRPTIERGELARELAFGAYSRRWSVTDGRYKLIIDGTRDQTTLYDLASDPSEQRDILADDRRNFRRLAKALSDWRETSQSEPPEEGETTEERLRALGYL